MARYIIQDVVRDTSTGAVINGASVVFYLADTSTLATVYVDKTTGTALAGSATTSDSQGKFVVYVDTADYATTQEFKWIATSGSSSFTKDDLHIFDIDTTPSLQDIFSIEKSTRNLAIKNNATNPNSQLDISMFSNVFLGEGSIPALTLDITASGVNGLDTGVEAPSTWYSVWYIYNGTTAASLLSTSATSPVMPSGYTQKILIGAVYNDSSSNFMQFHQYGRKIYYDDPYTLNNALASGSATTWTAIDLSAYVPSVVNEVYIDARSDTNATFAGNQFAKISSFNDGKISHAILAASTSSFTDRTMIGATIPLITSQTIYYMVDDANVNLRVYVNGFTMP